MSASEEPNVPQELPQDPRAVLYAREIPLPAGAPEAPLDQINTYSRPPAILAAPRVAHTEVMLADVGPLINAPVFSIRNGKPEDVRPLIVRPTIPEYTKWVTVQGMHPSRAIEFTDLYIKSAWLLLCQGAPANWSPELRKKAAVTLGTARAIATMYYEIGEADLIPGETSPAVFHVSFPTDAGYNGRADVVYAPHVTNEMKSLIETMPAMDPSTRDAAANVAISTIGVIPLQGWSLINTGHHYLSDKGTVSFRAYLAVEKQHWRSAALKPWLEDNLEEMRDIMWHKSMHPVSMVVKLQLATEERVKQMLIKSGTGSSAARLPAVETELKVALTARQVMASVRPLFSAYGGSLNYDVLEDAIQGYMAYTGPNGSRRPEIAVPRTISSKVTNKQTAITYLSDVYRDNQDTVAIAYGFYCAVSESTFVQTAAMEVDTLRSSNSLVRLKNQCFASFVLGGEYHKDFTAMRNAKRAAGEYAPPKLEFI